MEYISDNIQTNLNLRIPRDEYGDVKVKDESVTYDEQPPGSIFRIIRGNQQRNRVSELKSNPWKIRKFTRALSSNELATTKKGDGEKSF